MFQVVDQWDCVVAEFENREDAESYIFQRMQAYKGRRCIAPKWTIREA